MDKGYQHNLEKYISSMYQARRLCLSGIISEEDYTKIDEQLAGKYGISPASIYRGYDLIISVVRGNISH